MNVFDIGVIAAIGVIVLMVYWWVVEKIRKDHPSIGTVLDIANWIVFICAIMSLLFG